MSSDFYMKIKEHVQFFHFKLPIKLFKEQQHCTIFFYFRVGMCICTPTGPTVSSLATRDEFVCEKTNSPPKKVVPAVVQTSHVPLHGEVGNVPSRPNEVAERGTVNRPSRNRAQYRSTSPIGRGATSKYSFHRQSNKRANFYETRIRLQRRQIIYIALPCTIISSTVLRVPIAIHLFPKGNKSEGTTRPHPQRISQSRTPRTILGRAIRKAAAGVI